MPTVNVNVRRIDVDCNVKPIVSRMSSPLAFYSIVPHCGSSDRTRSSKQLGVERGLWGTA